MSKHRAPQRSGGCLKGLVVAVATLAATATGAVHDSATTALAAGSPVQVAINPAPHGPADPPSSHRADVRPAPHALAPARKPPARPVEAPVSRPSRHRPSSPPPAPISTTRHVGRSVVHCENGYLHPDGVCGGPVEQTFPYDPGNPCAGTASQCLDATLGLPNDISTLLGSGTPLP